MVPLQQVVRKKIRVRERVASPVGLVTGGGQPAAPASDSGNNRAAASGAKRPHQEDDIVAKRPRDWSAVPPWQDDDENDATAKRRRRREQAAAHEVLMNRTQQQPAALSTTGAMMLDFAIPKIPEYTAASTRPLRKQPLYLAGAGGASHDVEPLRGHDVLDIMLSWREQPTERPDGQPAAPREPARYVCWKLMELFKKAKKAYQEDSLSAFDESIGQASVECKREDTSNWKREYGGALKLRRPPHLERASEVEAILKEHEGEARVWQTSREEWFPIQNVPLVRTIPSVKVGRRRRSPARIPP